LGQTISTRARTPTASVDADSVERAAADLRPYLEPTPLQHSQAFTSKAGCHVYLKVESIQPTRAFKVRGALTKLLRMGREERAAGVITASAGNHGQGVAYAAQAFHVPATVYVPENANPLKVEAIKRMGGRVIPSGRSYHDAAQEALRAQVARPQEDGLHPSAAEDGGTQGQRRVGRAGHRDLPGRRAGRRDRGRRWSRAARQR